ncbi:MAG: hypothetical protein RIS29_838 [Bacteroidota bacterium]
MKNKDEDCNQKSRTLRKEFDFFRDPEGILTPDLQNRNLTFYTAELRSRFCGCKGSKIIDI